MPGDLPALRIACNRHVDPALACEGSRQTAVHALAGRLKGGYARSECDSQRRALGAALFRRKPLCAAPSGIQRLVQAAPACAPAAAIERGCQTALHAHASNLDGGHAWSEWDLRRRALGAANLRNKATHSAQTALSACRRDSQSQVRMRVAQTTRVQSSDHAHGCMHMSQGRVG